MVEKTLIDYDRLEISFHKNLVKEVLPEYFTSDYPNLITFLESYYDFLDSGDNFGALINDLYTIRDIEAASLKQLDVLSHNLSNAKTTGYKKSISSFRDVYSQKISLLSPQKIGNGALLNEVRQMRSQGAFKETGQVLDLAIEGEGMFVLGGKNDSDIEKAFFTRDGSFSIDQEGFIVSSLGKRLKSVTLDDIEVPRSAIFNEKTFNLSDLNISKNGMVQATFLIDQDEVLLPGETKSNIVNLGRVGLASFSNPTKLKSTGSNLFVATQKSGPATIGNLDCMNWKNLFGKR